MQDNNAKPKILVVDDTPANIVAMRSVLKDIEVDIYEADSGKEALMHCLKNDFSVALLDVQMPEMDGYEVAELMRSSARSKYVPIIFVTAKDSDDADKIQGYETGAVDYITKPINTTILRSKVNVFVELYKQRQQLKILNETLDEINAELIAARKVAEQELQKHKKA